MEKQLQESSKVKLKLEQPAIMCSGRERVECYYRGIVRRAFIDIDSYVIRIKAHGEEKNVTFLNGKCITEGWEDLKIM